MTNARFLYYFKDVISSNRLPLFARVQIVFASIQSDARDASKISSMCYQPLGDLVQASWGSLLEIRIRRGSITLTKKIIEAFTNDSIFFFHFQPNTQKIAKVSNTW
jgi:hypothetical protein